VEIGHTYVRLYFQFALDFSFIGLLLDGVCTTGKTVRISPDESVSVLVFQMIFWIFGPDHDVMRLHNTDMRIGSHRELMGGLTLPPS
jgi:hypothetical protein